MAISILNSIIIPLFGNEDLLYNLLSTLLPTIDSQCEIIVVDDGLEAMKINPNKLPRTVKYLSNETNRGYSYSVNKEIRASSGKYITTINSDILLETNWLRETRRTFEEQSNIGMVGARLIYPTSGRVQSSGKIHNGNILVTIHRMRNPSELPNEIYEVSTISDALATMPKSVVEEVGLYDEDFFNSFDDLDLCMRIREKGYRIICNPLIIGYHHTSASQDFRFAHAEEGAKLFFSRWWQNLNENLSSFFQQSLKEFNTRGHIFPTEAYIIRIARHSHSDVLTFLIQETKIQVIEEYDYSCCLQDVPKYAQRINIDLIRVLPFSLLLINYPIVYIVDSFAQLAENYYWAIKRNNQLDVIVDGNLNIYMLNEIAKNI